MNILRKLSGLVLLVVAVLLLQSCSKFKEDMKNIWNTRHLPGTWVMVEQETVMYDAEGKVVSVHKSRYSPVPGDDTYQKMFVVTRYENSSRHGYDKFDFEQFRAYKWDWERDGRHEIYYDLENDDMYEINTDALNPIEGEVFFGHVEKLDFDDLKYFKSVEKPGSYNDGKTVFNYEWYEVYTSFRKVR